MVVTFILDIAKPRKEGKQNLFMKKKHRAVHAKKKIEHSACEASGRGMIRANNAIYFGVAG